ncbi:MAG TPA: trypsin-like peptidase domain-containing protein [Urbifossiella sp.]|jgi:S1-C subfamily serine protease|nr:trypsin-like peptidase domain-containing protein [Urbifossiella sp.]
MVRRFAVAVGLGGCAVLGGAAAQLAFQAPTLASAHSLPLPPVPVPGEISTTAPQSDRFPAVVRSVSSAVVAVDAVKPNPAAAAGKTKEESGSGVLVRFPAVTGTVVVTNNHVVGDAPRDKVYVTLSDGRILQPVRILADPESDVSLLQLADDSLPACAFADSDRVVRGQYVLAFGSPFGLNQTVTHGIISATDRGQISLGSTIRIKEFLQTDASINPGSSGGPLVDLDGKVVGINTAIASQNGNNTGVSFSIPANLVKRVAGQLFEKGTVTRGYLGVQLAATIDPAEALRVGLTRVCGGMVEIVHPNTPAAAAGLRAGDVVLRLEDVDLRDEHHLINLVSALPPGQRVRLAVWRDRKAETVEVVIGEYAGGRQAFRR